MSMSDVSIEYLTKNETEAAHGKELEVVAEVRRPGVAPVLMKQFHRRIDMGDSYVIINHVSNPSGGDGHTSILSGKCGESAGGVRVDEIEIVLLLPDGGVKRMPRQLVQVSTADNSGGLDTESVEKRFKDLVGD